ncbi:MAG: ubiquinone biosynthesis accessory factor UbiJ [Pseudomonadales bacterium]
MITTAAILACEAAINKALRSDSASCRALAELSGVVFEFETLDSPLHFYLIPLSSGISIQQHFDGSADTQFSGTMQSFCQLASEQDSAAQLFGNGVTIKGNHTLATKLQSIIKNAQIDWQGILAEHCGDLIASQAAALFSMASSQAIRIAKSLELNTAEFLQEESRQLPSPPEVEYFLTQTRELQQRSERLEARILLLQSEAKV